MLKVDRIVLGSVIEGDRHQPRRGHARGTMDLVVLCLYEGINQVIQRNDHIFRFIDEPEIAM